MLLKRQYMMNYLKKVNAIQAIDTSHLVKKANYNSKIEEIEKEIPDRNKYISINEFNKLTKERLKQASLPSKNDVVDFLKRTGFNEKLIKTDNIRG